ncbi:MAG: MobC family plasmid mobilization relaxosome protein [Rikenellaceae bacterium]|nr:MobC family plasmid mobilization relaxosome protein [Rikenellaceae bacterium]MCL2692952.1 MobC family plasmid mobilization relaxosome protein [Rikenellaceae bacterium]
MGNAQEEKQRRGRPAKEKEKLSRSINLKLTEADYEAIRQKAESLGMTATQYARHMTLTGRIKPRYTKEELDLRRKIAGMANNLNQIARKANVDEFRQAGSDAYYLFREIKKLLDDS